MKALFAFVTVIMPLMLLSFWAGVISTKEIPMDGFPEKPSNTYLVVSNLAQKVIAMVRPKKEDDSNQVWFTNTSGFFAITNIVYSTSDSIGVTYNSTNDTWTIYSR